MAKVVVQGRITVPHTHRLRAKLPDDWQIESFDPDQDNVADFAGLIADADAIVGGAIPLPEWPDVPHLKLFQIPWAGYEFCNAGTMPAGVPVANCYEHESSIAEYVMLAMLEWQIGLRHMDKRWREVGWGGHGPGNSAVHGEVLGKTVGIVGYGHIGFEIARRANAFGMKVQAIRRRSQEPPPELVWLGGAGDLDRLLSTSDFVVIACDLNDSTRGLIDAARLAAMPSHAVIINIARGSIIAEEALFQALRDRRIGGAVIDVWYNYAKPGEPEPWPSNFPFQDLDNVLLSGHQSGWTEAQIDRRWSFVAANLERVRRSLPPENVVFVGKQQRS